MHLHRVYWSMVKLKYSIFTKISNLSSIQIVQLLASMITILEGTETSLSRPKWSPDDVSVVYTSHLPEKFNLADSARALFKLQLTKFSNLSPIYSCFSFQINPPDTRHLIGIDPIISSTRVVRGQYDFRFTSRDHSMRGAKVTRIMSKGFFQVQ